MESKPNGSAAILLFLIAFRLVNAQCVRTFFQPDEYFQALEPAWRIAFGPQSGAWLTWEWQHQLRSSLHPALFGGVYVVIHHVTQLLTVPPHLAATALVDAPKAVQAVFAALGDYYTWKLAAEIYGTGGHISTAALWMTVLNPWQWYCSTRTFSNSIETTLTVMALYHWPWRLVGDERERKKAPSSNAQSLRLSLLLAATAVVLRPTNLLIWLAILTLTVTRLTLDGESPLTPSVLVGLARDIVLYGSFILAISVALDRLYFGFWAFPPYKWLHFNISQSLAVFYGRNDWHYYLSQGIPLLSTTFLPLVLVGLYGASSASVAAGPAPVSSANAAKTLAFAVIATIATLSTISHKEVRFVYPLLPILHVLAAPHFSAFFFSASPVAPPSQKHHHGLPTSATSPKLKRKSTLAVATTINLVLAGYLSCFHQPAPLSVLEFLRGEYQRIHPDSSLAPLNHNPNERLAKTAPLAPGGSGSGSNAEGEELFALFLMPCHSTPWRSHLVFPTLRARALTCEPPLHTVPGTRERDEYLDEADRFYADPARFLAREMWPSLSSPFSSSASGRYPAAELPRFIVGFEGIEDMLVRFFEYRAGDERTPGIKIRRVWEGWNGFFNEDWRRRGLMVVWDVGISGE